VVKFKNGDEILHKSALDVYCKFCEISRKCRRRETKSSCNKNASVPTFEECLQGEPSPPLTLSNWLRESSDTEECKDEVKMSSNGRFVLAKEEMQGDRRSSPWMNDRKMDKETSGYEGYRKASTDSEHQSCSEFCVVKEGILVGYGEYSKSTKGENPHRHCRQTSYGSSLVELKQGEEPHREVELGNRKWNSMFVKPVRNSIVLEQIPGDFLKPIRWKVDCITYSASNVDNLRKKHEIIIEGAFQKRCKAFRWRNYHGFLMSTGIMIYFRDEGIKEMSFKKTVDFRKSAITGLNMVKCRLDVQTSNREMVMKFSSKKNLYVWYESILQFSL